MEKRTMGADIVHGRLLTKEIVADSATSVVVPQRGGYESASYSTIEEAIRHCEQWGVTRQLWPIYYGAWQGDVDLEGAQQLCRALYARLTLVPESERRSNWFLARVYNWRNRGEVFCVWE
jgi:hypothetical protein